MRRLAIKYGGNRGIESGTPPLTYDAHCLLLRPTGPQYEYLGTCISREQVINGVLLLVPSY